MCVTLILPNGDLCTHVGALRKALHPSKIIVRDGYAPLDSDDCLCPVDIEAIGKREGWSLARDDFDSMRWVAA